MGSFQQITMGVICLVAAFWFGAYLQDRPAGQNQTAKLLPDGTIDPNQPVAGSNFLASTKGFLSSMFESPAKKKPITVDDLRQRSQIEAPNAPSLEALHKRDQFGNPSSPSLVNENLLKLTGDALETPVEQRFVGSFASNPTSESPIQPITPPSQAKVAIVPDFSSLAEEVNRGLSFNNAPTPQPLKRPDNTELIPVPKFSDVQTRKPKPLVADADWEAVRQQVAAAESRLEDYRHQMTEPIPEIADSVTQHTQEFWDRKQTKARRQRTQLVRSDSLQRSEINPTNRLSSTRQSRLKPETFVDKQKRWDVFSPNEKTLNQTAMNQSIATQPETIQNTAARNYQPPSQPMRSTQPSIVEVDRGFSVADRGFVSQQSQPAGNSSARVRSLNDDRNSGIDSSPYVQPQQNRVASQPQMIRQPADVRNQLRPEFDPNPGSGPEFVSPPDHGQFQTQPSSSPSEIVQAAKVAYGSFSEYKTQSEDTLQNISQRFYGSPDYYFDLYLANRDLLSNPATVPAGLTIKIPKFDGR